MISSISIKWFETHLDTLIKLHQGVNVVVGESDEGKSGIVRGVRWNTHNRPQGDSYRNDKLDLKDKKDKFILTEVGIKYNKEESLVLRARDGTPGGVNHYQIDEDEPLRALRSDVPDEVKILTRMKDVNIQGQHPSEQYFLIGDKPGQIAKEFNKVAGLVEMDKAAADINSQVRSCNSMIRMSKLEIEDQLIQIKDTEWVDKADILAKKLNAFEKKMLKKQKTIEELNSILIILGKTESSLAKYNSVYVALSRLDELKDHSNDIDRKIISVNQVCDAVLAIKHVDSQLTATHDIQDAVKHVKSLNLQQTKIDKNQYKLETMQKLLNQFVCNKEDLIFAESDLIDANTNFNVIRTKYACPVCGRKGK